MHFSAFFMAAVILAGAAESRLATQPASARAVYRRAYLSEVCAGTHGFLDRYAYPSALAQSGTVTLYPDSNDSEPDLRVRAGQQLGLTIEQVQLEPIAGPGEGVSSTPGAVVFWKPANDAQLAALVQQLKGADEAQAASAAAALGRLADKRAFTALLAALADTRPRVRAWVMNSLEDQYTGRTPDSPPSGRVSILRFCLPEGGGRLVADGLAAAAGPFEQARWLRIALGARAKEVVPLATKLLSDSTDTPVRTLAATVLARMGDAKAVPVLLKALAMPVDPAVGRQVAAALTRLPLGGDTVQVVKIATQNPSPAVRALAVSVLGGRPGRTLRDALFDILAKDSDATVRTAAAEALGHHPLSTIDPLVKALKSDASPAVRAAAAKTLGGAGMSARRGTATVEESPVDMAPRRSALIDALADADPAVRIVAAEGLGHLGKESVPAILKALAVETDAAAVVALAKAVGEIQDPDAVPALVKTLTGPDEDQARRAAAALFKYTFTSVVRREDISETGAGFPTRNPVTQSVTPLLTSDHPVRVRQDAARVLWQVHDPASIGPLVHAMNNDPDGTVRVTAAEGLAAMVEFGSVYELLRNALLTHRDEGVRGVAAKALGESGVEAAGRPLVAVLLDATTPRALREQAASSLATLRPSDPQVLEMLGNILQVDAPAETKSVAAYVLGRIRHPQAVSPLVWLLQNSPSHDERTLAASDLCQTADPQAMAPLANALAKDEDPEVRDAAAKALGSIKDRAILDPLWQVMNDKKQVLTWGSAAQGLRAVPDPVTVPRMIQLLENNQTALRALAAQVLGALKDPLAMEPLIARLKIEKDATAAKCAAEALSAIAPDRADVKAALAQYAATTRRAN